MTWAIKIRGDAKSLIAAEYECPVHGRFEIMVPRDEVPDALPCQALGLAHPEYQPSPQDTAEDFHRARRHHHYRCGKRSPWRFPSPARTRVQRVTAARRGKDPERPANCMDWQAAAYDECSPEEWEAKERKKDFESVRKIVKGALR